MNKQASSILTAATVLLALLLHCSFAQTPEPEAEWIGGTTVAPQTHTFASTCSPEEEVRFENYRNILIDVLFLGD